MQILRSITLVLIAAAAAKAHAGVSGRVLDADGQPLAGARVESFAPETPDERIERLLAGRARAALASVVTSADGSFRLASADPVVDVEATASGFAPDGARRADGAVVTFSLRKAATVRGEVVSGGRPVAGATVAWTFDSDEGGLHELVQRSGADGGYDVPEPAGWASGLVVVHSDYAPLSRQQGRMALASAPRVELTSGLTVEGRAVDAAGRGVFGATLAVDGWPLGRSGADGGFVLRHVPSGWTTLAARSAGAWGATGPRPGPLVVRLEPQPRLTGSVRERRTGRPLAGASIVLHSMNDGGAFWASTDAAGRYRIDAPEGRYYAMVTRPGFVPVSGGDEETGAVEIRRTTSSRHDFELASLVRVRGRVQDEKLRPVKGAFVKLAAKQAPRLYSTREGYWGTSSAWTAADGTFELGLVPPEGREVDWTAVALKPGYAMGVAEGVRPGASTSITLTRGVELAGRVVDEAGTPIAGAAVVLAESSGFTGTLQRAAGSVDAGWARSDAQGAFATRVRPAAHELLVLASGRVPKAVRAYEPSGGSPLAVVLEPAVEIRGRALRADGAGVAGVNVYAWRQLMGTPSFATTDESGAFVLTGLAPGTYQLHAARDERPFGEARTVEAPAVDLRIELPPSGRIEGRVTSARSRLPLDRFTVTLDPSGEDGEHDDGASTEFPTGAPAEEAGRFTMSEVPYGETAVVVMAPGFTARRIESVVVSEAGETPELEIALEPGVTLRGRVTGEDGEPLSEVAVNAGGEWYEHVSAQSNAQGEYELEGLPAAPVELTFLRSGWRSARRTVDASRESRADVVLSRGVAVSGVVVAADGKGVAKVYVRANSSVAGADEATAATDRNGRFSISGLSAARYNFTAHSPEGGEAKAEDVDVERTGPLRLVLTRPRTAVLTGRVVGLPATGAEQFVFVQAKGDEGADQGQVDATGAFRLEKVPAGVVRVSAMATSADGSGRSSRVNTLELAAGSESETLIEFSNDITVAGTVVRDGLPAAGAAVSFQSKSGHMARAQTDASGRYSVQGLEPGLYEVGVSGIDLSYEAEHVVTGSAEIDIDATGAALAGSVFDATSGSAIGDAEVSLWRLDTGETRPSTTVRTTASGAFQARSVREGAYRLLTSRDGYGQDAREIELRRGAAEEQRIDLTPAEGLGVEVVDARDGRALEAVVVVRDLSRRVIANRHSGVGADGTLTIPLAAGSYLLSTSASGYGTATLAVRAPGRGLRVPLTPGGTLVIESGRDLRGRLRLVRPDGEEYVRCWCSGIAGFDLEGRRTTAANVTPGSYRVEIVDAMGRPLPAPASVTIEEGRTTTLTVE